MVSYDLPIKISRNRGGYSIAVALNDQVVVSRQISRADLVQLQVILAELLDGQPAASVQAAVLQEPLPEALPLPEATLPDPGLGDPLPRRPAGAGDDFLFDIDG